MQSRLDDVKEVMEIPKVERFAARPALDCLLKDAQLSSRQERSKSIYAA
jgi:hypothetical protein